jgi:protein TonB
MKYVVLIFVSIFCSYFIQAQNDTINNFTEEVVGEEEELIFIYVKQMPEFPGGFEALRKYIDEHIIYPKEAKEKRIQGYVFIRFQVKKDGTIGKVEIQKGVHDLLDTEAVRVIKSLPPFIPAEQNGKKVSVWYSIPVIFELN